MSACNITINFTGEGIDFFQNIKSKIINQGGTLTGDASGGNLRVPLLGSYISGLYSVANQQINITIDHKPIFVSCKQIQSYLENNL
jgi:hypothetical protein